jgi:hypothetical protein
MMMTPSVESPASSSSFGRRKITRIVDDDAAQRTFYSTPSFDGLPRAIGGDDDDATTMALRPAVGYRCMWCTLAADRPIGCPVDSIDAVDARGRCVEDATATAASDRRYVTFGVFCCLNCAKAYVDARPSDARFARSDRLLVKMAMTLDAVFHGADGAPGRRCPARARVPVASYATLAVIRPSPDPMLLTCYGGPMSEERYRATIGRAVYECRGELKLFPMSVAFRETTSSDDARPR